MGTRGGGEDQIEVSDRGLHGIEQSCLLKDVVGPGGGPLGGDVRPTVAGIHKAQPAQRKIAHGARGHADILAELRLDQDHDGAREVGS